MVKLKMFMLDSSGLCFMCIVGVFFYIHGYVQGSTEASREKTPVAAALLEGFSFVASRQPCPTHPQTLPPTPVLTPRTLRTQGT